MKKIAMKKIEELIEVKKFFFLLVGGSTDDDLDDERVVGVSGATSGGTGTPGPMTTASSCQPPAPSGTARFPRRSILKSRRSEESLSPLSDPTAGGAGSGLVPGLSTNSIFFRFLFV